MKPSIRIAALVWISLSGAAFAMPIKTEMMKPRAYFQEAENHLLEALDLKSKTLTFVKKDFEQCGSALVRRAQTLTFSCTLAIPTKARISRLQNMVTGNKIETAFGSSKREVAVAVAGDARSITLTTTFDSTGVDFEVAKFNDDFFAVYAKAAQLTISEALAKQRVRLEVLESL